MSALFDMKKIKIQTNNKKPIEQWSLPNNRYSSIDTSKFNTGILTGRVNNIIVLDIDYKDNGIDEFNKYISIYGKPNTFTQKTTNNGFHYYFSFEHSKIDIEYIIQNCLVNKSKYRGVGIDIRSNGGYVVSYPSIINNSQYTILNDIPIIEMPETLVK